MLDLEEASFYGAFSGATSFFPQVDYAALLDYRLYASRQVDSKIFGEHSPSLSEHAEILPTPYRPLR
jgi:hypothetical protein